MTPNMTEVARLAGVSISTVSHVINGTRKVSSDATAAVQRAIEATGYVPDIVARSLVGASTNTIGLALPALSNRYFAEIFEAIQAGVVATQRSFLFADTGDDEEREQQAIKELLSRRVDGIIMASCGGTESGALPLLRRVGIPVVLIDRLVSEEFDQVGAENQLATTELVEHLLSHGHRRIGIIAAPASIATTVERIAGYRDGLAAAGIGFDPTLVTTGSVSVKPVREAVAAMLELADPPTALIAANNLITVGALRALKELRRRIPEDVALVGFDDFDWADLVSPALTTLTHQRDEIGHHAVRLLADRLADPTRPPTTLRLPAKLKIRNSCGC
jgi:LacI family transcriptional regulator